MKASDFGLWIVESKYNYKMRRRDEVAYLPENFDFNSLKGKEHHGVHVELRCNGKTLCNLRESNKNYLWLEEIDILRSTANSNTAHLNNKDPNPVGRVKGLRNKISDLMEVFQQIDLILEKAEKQRVKQYGE